VQSFARLKFGIRINLEENMLEQLIESSSTDNKKTNSKSIIFTTFILLTTLCFSAVLWSLFARNLNLVSGDLEIASILPPVNIIEPKVEEDQTISRKESSNKTASNEPISRKVNMSRVDEGQEAPDKVSVERNSSLERPVSGKVTFGKIDSGGDDSTGKPDGQINRKSDTENGDGVITKKTVIEDTEEPKKFEKKPKVEKVEKIEKSPVIRSLGVVNGSATYLPKPTFSAAAKAVGASGLVTVQITIDEQGNVISAKVMSGHPMLRSDCERAARNTKFSPTLLSKQAVKATGILTYNFIK
jgi:TonB family protein